MILSIPFEFASAVVGGADSFAFPALTISAIGTILTVTAPFTAGVTALLYFDQRMRREALDLELAQTAR
jgi:hypothetical protein